MNNGERIVRPLKQWTPQGASVAIPPFDHEPYPHIGMQFCETTNWISKCLGQCGLPVFYGTYDMPAIHLLAGEQIAYYTDDELRHMLSEKAIVDGAAALELCKRGFAPMLGVIAEDGHVEVTTEKNADGTWSSSFSSEVKFTKQDVAEELSGAYYVAHVGAEAKYVMPASVYFKNHAGGEVITTGIDLARWHFMRYLCPARKIQYIQWMDKLGGVSAYLPEMQDIKLYCGTLPDGALVCAIINYSYDPLKLRLALKTQPRAARMLMPEGDFQPIEYSFKDGIAMLGKSLEAGQVAVIRFEQ